MIGYSYVEGQDITYIKKTRNVKVGYKNKKDDDDDDDDDDLYKKKMKKMHKRTMKKTKKCRHGHKGHKGRDDEKSSQINIEAVTGAVELYFLES